LKDEAITNKVMDISDQPIRRKLNPKDIRTKNKTKKLRSEMVISCSGTFNRNI
jgi:hypothetical protein